MRCAGGWIEVGLVGWVFGAWEGRVRVIGRWWVVGYACGAYCANEGIVGGFWWGVRGGECFVEGYRMLSEGMRCCIVLLRVWFVSDCVLLCCFAEVARCHFVGVGEGSEECGAAVEAYGFGYFLDWHVG